MPPKRRPIHGPEWHLQHQLVQYLRTRGWLVERMIGNAYQMGIPDLYAHHPKWGSRWIDVKVEGKYNFTKAQKAKWPIWDSFGVGIWILTGANQEQYDRLFRSPNWKDYWKASWGVPDVTSLIDELFGSEEGLDSLMDINGNLSDEA